MRLSRRLFAALVLAASLRADVVETRDAIVFGKVLSSTPARVVIAVGNRRQLREIDGKAVRSLIFDKNCRSYLGKLPTAGMQPPT